MVTMKSLTASFLRQRWTMLAAVLGCLDNCPIAGHDAGSTRGITFAPRIPFADLAVEDCKLEMVNQLTL